MYIRNDTMLVFVAHLLTKHHYPSLSSFILYHLCHSEMYSELNKNKGACVIQYSHSTVTNPHGLHTKQGSQDRKSNMSSQESPLTFKINVSRVKAADPLQTPTSTATEKLFSYKDKDWARWQTQVCKIQQVVAGRSNSPAQSELNFSG